jgi:hypothetical protein
MRNSDRAWVALAGGVAAYDLIATNDEQLSNAAFLNRPPANRVVEQQITTLRENRFHVTASA